MIKELLEKRNLPLLWDGEGEWSARRAELVRLLSEEEYGFLPPPPDALNASLVSERKEYGGKALRREYELSVRLGEKEFSFRYALVLPVKDAPVPVFVLLSHTLDFPNPVCPADEIVDNGFGVAQLNCMDAVTDHPFGDFSNGLGLWVAGERKGSEWGKIGMWSYAASRVVDHLVTLPEADGEKLFIIGHSRFGKTALWCGAMDERFRCVIANESGAGGAAIYRGKEGEKISNFCDPNGYGYWDWFCENMKRYYGRDDDAPFDQHMAVALIAPRHLLVGGAVEDMWGDPFSEYLSCKAASFVWEKLGHKGLISPDRMPVPGDDFPEGRIGYHLRAGGHYLNRTDWLSYMAYIKKHIL